jgi:hypothetical protein
MGAEFDKLCSYIQGVSSEDAATWRMEHYPVDKDEFGYAIRAIAHRSWKKPDQIKLAKHYLKRIPFASARGYETFISVMSISSVVEVIYEYVPRKKIWHRFCSIISQSPYVKTQKIRRTRRSCVDFSTNSSVSSRRANDCAGRAGDGGGHLRSAALSAYSGPSRIGTNAQSVQKLTSA